MRIVSILLLFAIWILGGLKDLEEKMDCEFE